MKTMNKYLKVVLCFIAFVICSFMVVLSPSIAAVSAMEYTEAEYNLAINAIKMPTKINAQENKFEIPFHTQLKNSWGDADTVTQIIRVIDPAGTAHDYTIGGTKDVNDYDFFGDYNSTAPKDAEHPTEEELNNRVAENFVRVNALNNGNYQVVYITKAVKGSGDDAITKTYYSNIYNVTVENVSYELDFTNSEGLLNLYKSEVAVNSGRIEVFDVKANIVGGTNGTTLTPAQCVTVTKNGAIQDYRDDDSDFKYDATTEKYYINPTTVGEYKIEYTFKESTNRPTKTFTIKVVEADDLKEGTKLTADTPNLPSMEIGQTGITLPKLTVNNEYSKDIAHNVTKIIVKKQYSDIYFELGPNTYTFDFTLENAENADSYEELAGIYEVTYYFQDAYGNIEGHMAEKTIKTSYISVSTKPEVYLSYNYDIVEEESALQGKNNFKVDGKVVTDYAETELKSNYGYSEVYLPAMYGTDKLTATQDLIFVRYLRNANTNRLYYVDNLTVEDGKLVEVEYGEPGYNYAFQTNADDKETKTGTPNQAQAFKFSATGGDATFAGEYYLEYEVVSTTVKDRTGNLYMPGTTKEYSITVTKDPTNTSESVVKTEIKNVTNTTIRPEKGIKITVASSDEKEFDKRIKNAVFYYTSTTSSNSFETDVKTVFNAVKDSVAGKENVLDSNAFKTYMKDTLGYKNFNVISESDTKNEFVLDKFDTTALQAGDASFATNNKVVVYAVALNDNTQFAVDPVELTLKQTTESEAPTADIVDYGSLTAEVDPTNKNISDAREFKQSDTITLPTIKFSDNADNLLQMSVKYYIETPETDAGLVFKTPNNVEYDFVNNKVKGGSLSKLATGNYYVVYTAIDDAGNTSVTYFTFTVVDSSNPILSVDVVSENEFTQSGNTITTDVNSVLNFEALVRSGDGKFTDYTSKSTIDIKVTNENGLSAIPSGETINSYKFEDVGTYTVTISAYLTAEPERKTDVKVIYIEVKKPTISWLEDFDIPQHATMDSIVYLPDIAASHNAKVTVNVTAPGGAAPKAGDAYKTVEGGYSVWAFKTNENTKGTYTIKYTATSIYGVITKEFSIKVGDSVAPTINMEYENELAQNIVYKDSDIEYVFDVVKSISNRKFVITVNRDGEQVYSYNLGLNITDIDDDGTPSTNYSWSNLKYELKGDKVKSLGNDKYAITGTGECTLVLTITDSYNNTTTKEIYFNVVTETEAEEVSNTVLGTVLIVISLVVLAGVIMFFIFTGNGKGGSKKTSKKLAKEIKETIEEKNANEVKEEVKAEVVEEEKVEEKTEEVEPATEEVVEEPKAEETTETSNDDDAKTGEVE